MNLLKRPIGDDDRLTALPDGVRILILSKIGDGKEVVRSCLLSSHWKDIWKFVPMRIRFEFPTYSIIEKEENLEYAAATNRDLHYWGCCDKILSVEFFPHEFEEYIEKDINLWVYFAFNIAKVEGFTLKFRHFRYSDFEYTLPKFAYKNCYVKNVVLGNCRLNPSYSIQWTNLQSLTMGKFVLENSSIEQVLIGCPSLQCLELDMVYGISVLNISSIKLEKLMIRNHNLDVDPELEDYMYNLSIFAPNVQHFEISGLCRRDTCLNLIDVSSLATVVISIKVDFVEITDQPEKLIAEGEFWQQLLRSVTHVHRLELGQWSIQSLSILEASGWRFLP